MDCINYSCHVSGDQIMAQKALSFQYSFFALQLIAFVLSVKNILEPYSLIASIVLAIPNVYIGVISWKQSKI
jgi:hypothetical protein